MKPIREDWARTIDCCAKVVTALAIVFGGWWTLHQYQDNLRERRENNSNEASRPYRQKRLDIYFEVTSVAATIATSKDKTEVARAKDKFFSLYHGPASIVANSAVQSSMQQIDVCLRDSKCSNSLTELVDQLSANCKNQLTTEWAPRPPTNLRGTAR